MTSDAQALDKLIASLRTAVETGDDALIDDGRLPPERRLMEIFGMRRRSVRQALDLLESEGLVFRRQGQGTFIKPTGAGSARIVDLSMKTSPSEIMEVRREIEPVLVKLATLRATPSDIALMERLVEKGAKATTSQQYERWDSAFHAKIAESARNSLFQGLFDLIVAVRVEQKWTGVRAKSFSAEIRDTLVEQHKAIVSAITERDPDAAETAMRNHLGIVTRIVGA
jgi:GntR family transcriptional repressor for pyruvate dehydrogenase complex